MKKLGSSSVPFTLLFPRHSPTSVTVQPTPDDPEGTHPCGVEYYVRCYVLETEKERSHRKSAVSMIIRKIQYAPTRPGRQPCTVVKKDFMFSPGAVQTNKVTHPRGLVIVRLVINTVNLPQHYHSFWLRYAKIYIFSSMVNIIMH